MIAKTLPLPPALGQPVPTNRPHAISVQFPGWNDVVDFGLGKARVHDLCVAGYPRSFFHPLVQKLHDLCGENVLDQSQELALFPDYRTASNCKEFLTTRRIHGKDMVDAEDVSLLLVEFETTSLQNGQNDPLSVSQLYGVVLPKRAHKQKMMWWRLTGTGISSRVAERCLTQKFRITSSIESLPKAPNPSEQPVYQTIRERVAYYIERAPINTSRPAKVNSDDVYLYPSGMSAIYHVHHTLLGWRHSDIMMLGFPYELSIKMIETLGVPYRFLSFGTANEIDELEKDIKSKAKAGNKIQAVWCECPNNPMLRTCDFDRVRKLADTYDFLFVVDDTIGTFANVDVLDVADIVVTSLSKAFSGFANVLAGSITLNPNFKHYADLKKAFDDDYINNFYLGDALQLEDNSSDYLSRVQHQNECAEYVADFMYKRMKDPACTLNAVYYPKVCWSTDNYRRRMRPATEECTPGFGGFLSVAFESNTAAAAFFDNLHVYKGPSFGADVPIALPYVQLVLQQEKAWASSNGLNETLVRISAGLDDKDILLNAVKEALRAADATKDPRPI